MQGLQLLKERDIDKVSVWGDSMLVIQQVKGEYQCRDPILQQYCTMVQNLSRRFTQIEFYHVYRTDNQQANNLAQMASGYKDILDNDQSFDVIEVQKPAYVRLKSVLNIGVTVQTEDWREPIKQFLADPRPEADSKLRRQAVRYVLIDQQLYRRTEDEVFLRCVDTPEAELIMLDVHA